MFGILEQKAGFIWNVCNRVIKIALVTSIDITTDNHLESRYCNVKRLLLEETCLTRAKISSGMGADTLSFGVSK